jgi:TRAP-type mannitol/chloroaromatic compound transport system permease large subunit
MALIVVPTIWFMPLGHMTQGHYGLLMLALVVVAIMLGFPTAFTLMGMGVLFTFIAYRFSGSPETALNQTLYLMVQRGAYAVMNNDVLIAVPLFVFMGYLVERANLIERLFRSLHLAIGKIPGSLAVATLATCAVFATATGIIGAVVTLMGLLALPAMLKSGYNVKLSAGVITAGGTLGILIPPSVLLILYGATASVSVVQLYAGAFFPGIMLAGLYIAYVMVIAKLKPEWAPKPLASETQVALPPVAQQLAGGRRRKTLPTLIGAILDGRKAGVPPRAAWKQLAIALLPVMALAAGAVVVYRVVTTQEVVDTGGLQEMGLVDDEPSTDSSGLEEPAEAKEVAKAAPSSRYSIDRSRLRAEARAEAAAEAAAAPKGQAESGRVPAPLWFWIVLALLVAALGVLYALQTFERLEIFKMMLGSFFPLAILILAVLGSIIFGWATPTEAAAMGAGGGMLLAAAYRRLTLGVVKESVFLTAKTTAMVCWLFVGSSIFSAAFALLGGQEIIERWVLSLHMTPTQFMLLAQFIIFILGWPLEWTEIIVIFMPIFLPLLSHFHIDPLFFGLLVALNLQTAFLSPPVAMAAFYLKGVAPKHVTLNQIFGGMMPFMGIQILALALLYLFPQIGLWLPGLVYK